MYSGYPNTHTRIPDTIWYSNYWQRNYTCRLTLKQCTFSVVSMVKTPPLNDHLFSRLSNYSSVVSYGQTPEIIMINYIAGTKNGPGFTSWAVLVGWLGLREELMDTVDFWFAALVAAESEGLSWSHCWMKSCEFGVSWRTAGRLLWNN